MKRKQQMQKKHILETWNVNRETERVTDWQKRVHAQSNQCADYCTPVWQWTGSLNTGWTEPELRVRPCVLCCHSRCSRLCRLCPPFAPLHFGSKGPVYRKTPGNLEIASSSCLLLSPIFFGTRLSACLFVLVDAWARGPLAVRFGHAGHEEYPALTWHIRSDDWDRLAARSGRGYYKKEGKRETEGGVSKGVRERKREEEGGDLCDHIWAVVTPLGIQHSRVCRVFLSCLLLLSSSAVFLTCDHPPPLSTPSNQMWSFSCKSFANPLSHFLLRGLASSSACRLFNFSLLPCFSLCC